MLKRACLITGLIYYSTLVFSQDLKVNTDFLGKIELVNGKVLYGNIGYEVATNQVILEDKSEAQSFAARATTNFEFYDFKRNCYRKFYSLLYNNNPTFFEVLIETSNLALLSRENISIPNDSSDSVSSTGNMESLYNSETLFLVDKKGNIKPYIAISHSKQQCISNYITPYLLSTLTKRKYSQIRRFAKQNNYSLKNKDHLIEVLAYYSKLK